MYIMVLEFVQGQKLPKVTYIMVWSIFGPSKVVTVNAQKLPNVMYIMVLELFNLKTFQKHSVCNGSEVLECQSDSF